jgi:hypothetical protein
VVARRPNPAARGAGTRPAPTHSAFPSISKTHRTSLSGGGKSPHGRVRLIRSAALILERIEWDRTRADAALETAALPLSYTGIGTN